MAVYRYIGFDLRTGALSEQLPLTDVSFSGSLNRAGSFQATLPLNQQAQTSPGTYASMASAYLSATTPARTGIYVERDGVLVDAYIVWTRDYRWQNLTVALGGLSLWSYFGRRLIDTTLSYSATDQLVIARGLVNAAQTSNGGNIGITVGAETSGVARDRTYYSYEAKPVGEAVEQLAAVDNGFDFAIDVAYSAGVPTKTLRLSYPRRGRLAPDSGLVFEVGKNIIDYSYPEDGTMQANRFFGQGAGDGADMIVSTASRTDIIDAGWPLLDASAAWKDIQSSSLVAAYATAMVNARANPVTIPEMVVSAQVDPQLGSWIVGDYATFIFGGDPNKPDPRFPTRTSLIYRIVGYQATPGNEGEEVVKLVLN